MSVLVELVVRCDAAPGPAGRRKGERSEVGKALGTILRASQELPGRLNAQGSAMAGQAARSAAA